MNQPADNEIQYAVALFPSTGDALRAEKVLKQSGLRCKLIPVPRQLSFDCGVCLRLERQDEAAARQAFTKATVRFDNILPLE